MEESQFTAETLAKPNTQPYRTPEDFRRLPFTDIYHDSWLGPVEKERVIKARQAEVIIPQQMNLDHLKLICCRSLAEKETLRNLLSTSLWNEWNSRIKVVGHQPVFFKRWLYIVNATMHDDDIVLELNVPESPSDYGPYVIKATITDDYSGVTRVAENDYPRITEGRIRYYGIRKYGILGYHFRCEIDGDLAYLGRHQEQNIPF